MQVTLQFHSHIGVLRSLAAVSILLCSLVAGAKVATATCMPAPTEALRSLATLAGTAPNTVLRETQSDSAETMDASRFGWRQAARAEAYDTMSRPADARRSALQALRLTKLSSGPLHVELLTRYAMNGFRAEQIANATRAVQLTRNGQRPGSAADACLQIALGEMQRMLGTPEGAVVYLARAYRLTSARGMEQQHVMATEKLARVMSWAGDHLQAISLINEVVAWDTARARTFALSNDLYFRGSFSLVRGAYQAALADFERARALAPASMDPVGSGYLDLQTCATLIELAALDEATRACQRALGIFGRYSDPASGQAQLLLAQIAYKNNKPLVALSILTRLLPNKDDLATFVSAPKAYRLRSDVYNRLGRTSAAYRDLNVYVRLVEQQSKSEQARQSAVLRASFDADRAAARNRMLQQRLYFSHERERAQAQRYMVLSLAAAAGAVLLFIILGMGIVYRRKLRMLADTDQLTGLLNRRFVHDHEASLVTGHGRAGRALTLAVIDLDHFKAINDTHGHAAGDAVLVAFAERARSILRKGDVVARWGGEEFIMIFPQTIEEDVVDALQRLRLALAADIMTVAGPVTVRFSAGVATLDANEDLQSLVRRADSALYNAKAAGRNCTMVAAPGRTPRDLQAVSFDAPKLMAAL